jgi:alkanesulfonate monooxygenase SsuD/methylene tetrahydromethanopterin reductase-like flavin-dependent oxidoreductase (luciferase family)
LTEQLPIGVNIASIGTDPTWWLSAAVRLERAGYQGIWCWDHFMGRKGAHVPVVEAWTALSVAAGATERVELGPFVLNVTNRHPAVVAAMASTLQRLSGGRLVLGVGIGGGLEEHVALGMPLPDAAERVARLREAIAVMRSLWTGAPVTRPSLYYPLADAAGSPVNPAPPVIVGGETRAGARLAAEIGDGWTAFTLNFRQHLPVYLEALATAGKAREDQRVLVGVQGGVFADPNDPDPLLPWCIEPAETWESWHASGADGVILTAATEDDVDRLVGATDRW